MSYARLSEDCNVYVFLASDGWFECCFCNLMPGAFDRYHAPTTADMVKHLREHRAAGDIVPEDTIEDLVADAEENDAWMAERSDLQKNNGVT